MRLLSRLGYLRYAFKRVQVLFLLAGLTVFLGGALHSFHLTLQSSCLTAVWPPETRVRLCSMGF